VPLSENRPVVRTRLRYLAQLRHSPRDAGRETAFTSEGEDGVNDHREARKSERKGEIRRKGEISAAFGEGNGAVH
jgi:hypothetical protein